MGELGTYRLTDFIPMGPEVYQRLFTRLHADVWPTQLVSLPLGLTALWLAWRLSLPRADTRLGPWLGLLLGLGWVWVGTRFHLGLFTELNWAGTYWGWAFIAQGCLLAAAGLTGRWAPRRAGPRGASTPAMRVAGLGLGMAALLLYPLLAPLTGRDWSGTELVGTTPDATLVLTLGCLLLVRADWWLFPMPLLWCVFSGATWIAMGWPAGMVAPAAAALTAALLIGARFSPSGRRR